MLEKITGSAVWLLIAALLVALFEVCAGRMAQAAPRAQSGAECSAYADMAIVARALAQGQVDRAQSAAIMATIYDVREERHALMLAEILRAAFHDKRAPGEFATGFLMACAEGRGNVDGFLGVRS